MADGIGKSNRFPTTSWTMIVKARDQDRTIARQALERLCAGYWSPIFGFLRRKGLDPDHARDCTQAFFTALLEKDYLANLEPSRGNFRSFLLAAVNHFLSNSFDAERALKRGGGRPNLPLEFVVGDGVMWNGPEHSLTPEAVFEYQWASNLLERTLKRLRISYPDRDFDVMKPFLVGDAARGDSGAAARELEMSDGAFKVAIHRMRKRYRDALHAEILETVSDPAQVDGEIRYLMNILARRQ